MTGGGKAQRLNSDKARQLKSGFAATRIFVCGPACSGSVWRAFSFGPSLRLAPLREAGAHSDALKLGPPHKRHPWRSTPECGLLEGLATQTQSKQDQTRSEEQRRSNFLSCWL